MNAKDLNMTFNNLREGWDGDWPGLPRVMESCLAMLGNDPTSVLLPRTRAVSNCIQEVALFIEENGRVQARLKKEPDYHNRLHVSDTLVSLTTLLLLHRKYVGEMGGRPSHIEWVAMLTMLGHDLMHDGSINSSTSQIETRSAHYLQPFLERHKVHKEDQRAVKNIIISTDPRLVKVSHEKIAKRIFSLADIDCLTVLIQESDIMASAMPHIGPLLAKRLEKEWRKIGFSQADIVATTAGRIQFLRYSALFSSPASEMLGMRTIKSVQLGVLGADA